MKYDDESKKGRRSREIEIADEVIEVGLDAITEFLRSMEDAAEGHVLPVAIRSILAAVTRVVRERHPELPQFVVSKDESSRYLSRSRLGSASFGAKSYRPYISLATLYARSNTASVTI
ncbi:hypothetical protein [Rhizobium leguminosarum]|uniref:hypothetical protein n=1 Tax=Rhizobium leguminosarum TaxID=384 RepID=UPI0021BBC5FD|nr:hypothetical protein [Rhizobium leguminosarum]